ncbi:MAG: phosphohistidine phosphatase [Candidatus Latescibacterota bacterium]|jgi:phosphohistidine phosphatase
MKTLYLVRHAKSSWKHDVIDHERPLKGRGHNDAKLLAEKSATIFKAPQLILSSDANRALTTAHYFKEAFGVSEKKFRSNHSLYDFDGRQVMQIVNLLDNGLNRVMIVGHNHAFTSIANMLGNKYIENVPTSGFVAIEFDTDSWASLSGGKTLKTLFPKDLK